MQCNVYSMFYIINVQCEQVSFIYLSFFLFLQVVHKGRRLFGFIGHASPDALSFDVNYIWQEWAPDRQNCSLRCVASEVQFVLELRRYCYPAYARTRQNTNGVSNFLLKTPNTAQNGNPREAVFHSIF